MKHPYAFPLALQTVLPEKFWRDQQFCSQMQSLTRYGFSGVELNIANPTGVDLTELQEFLNCFDLKMTYFASGLSAKTSGLSLSSTNKKIHRNSVDFCLSVIEWLAGSGIGMIIGFLKGRAGVDVQRARAQFLRSLETVAPEAERVKVPLLIEATNRYESAVANSLADAAQILQNVQSKTLRILPDTFHMNIEEVNMDTALQEHLHLFDSIHISDNNRFFPGHGAIDFERVIQTLGRLGFKGGLAIEGNLKKNLVQDLDCTMSYLAPLLPGKKKTAVVVEEA